MQNAHQRFIIECMKLVRAYICGCCVNTAPDALITAAADGAVRESSPKPPPARC